MGIQYTFFNFQNLFIIHIVLFHINYRNLGKVQSIGTYPPILYVQLMLALQYLTFKGIVYKLTGKRQKIIFNQIYYFGGSLFLDNLFA